MTTTDIALRQTSTQDALALQKVGQALFQSGLYKNAQNAYGAYAIVQYGHELGIGPMMSLQSINIIQGKPAASGQLMLSLATSRGVSFQVEEETETACVITFMRGKQSYRSEFNMDDAKRAGLAGKDNWKKWPKEMLFWRAVAKGVRRIAPEAIMGLYTPDELSGGDVIDVEHVQVTNVEDAKAQPQEPQWDTYDLGLVNQIVDGARNEEDLAGYWKEQAIPKGHPQWDDLVEIFQRRKSEIRCQEEEPSEQDPAAMDPTAASFLASEEQQHA